MKIWGNHSCLTEGENLIKYWPNHGAALVLLYADIFESVAYTNPLIQQTFQTHTELLSLFFYVQL